MTVDLGTGDGRLPYALARTAAERLFIGLDANVSAMREVSGRACRARQANVFYVRAAVECLPLELAGVADEVTVVLPWGSLLAAVARPVVPLLRNIRGLCRPDARLTVVLALDAVRDRGELARLGLVAGGIARGPSWRDLAPGYGEAGFAITGVREMPAAELAEWPSTWARKLARSGGRSAVRLDARAGG